MGRASERTVGDVTIVERYPSFEGANILTGIGFKHVLYLAEDAVIQHCRMHQMGPQLLYEKYSLSLEIVEADARLLSSIHLDDRVRIEVRETTQPGEPAMSYSVRIFVARQGKQTKALSGMWKLLFRRDADRTVADQPPMHLTPYVVAEINRSSAPERPIFQGTERQERVRGQDPIAHSLTQGANAFVWRRPIPYFYCHYSKRLQHSGYLRLMEEVVALFLAERGISIRSMLERHRWIPAVTHTRMEILREAFMEEDLYTVFTIDNIFKKVLYTGRVDCYLVRQEQLIHTATGKITHGYVAIKGRRDWSLVRFDEATMAALRGPSGAVG